jgi:hypothetical protein
MFIITFSSTEELISEEEEVDLLTSSGCGHSYQKIFNWN